MSNTSPKRKSKKESVPIRYLLLFMTLLCAGAIFFSLTLNISGGPLHSAAGYVFVPMQKGIAAAGEYVDSVFESIRSFRTVDAENQELKQQIEELQNELTALKLDTYEIQEYKELLDLQSKYSTHETTAASVIAWDGGRWFSGFTIDKGTSDGVLPGMNVLSGTGLVGIVIAAGPNYATVRSIIDDASNVSGMVLTANANVIVSGSLESMNNNQTIRFSHLDDIDDKVSIGDPVVSSYISDEYHQGILIGYITSMEVDSNNITKSGEITPAVNFDHLNNVLVILDLKNTGAPDTEEEE